VFLRAHSHSQDGRLAGVREALDICHVEAGALLNLYKIAHNELTVDKWDNRKEVILN
jgi:hypothetical protein